ncbi:MAG: PIG-L deacetylase family protein, partial [Mycobacterium sp.]
QGGPEPTHVEAVDLYIDVAVDALAAHEKYLSVLDPHTSVREQAQQVIDMTTPTESGGRVAGFICERSAAR